MLAEYIIQSTKSATFYYTSSVGNQKVAALLPE